MAKKGVPWLVAVIFLIAALCSGDVVVFKTGERKIGLIKESESDSDNIVFLSVSGEMKIPRSRISRIDRETKDKGYTHIGRGFLELKDFSTARQYIDRALEINPENEVARALLKEIQTSLQEEAMRRRQEKVNQTDRDLALVCDLITNKKFEKGEQILKNMDQSDFSEEQAKTYQTLNVRLYHKWGDNSLDHLNPRAAAAFYEKALSIDPDNQEIYGKLLPLWEKDPTMTTELIEIYERQYNKSPNMELAGKLSDLHFRSRNYEKALPYLLTLHKNSKGTNVIAEERLRASFSQLQKDAINVQDYNLAAKIYRQYLDAFPGEDPTPFYYYQYLDMKKGISDDNLEGHIELGNFCREHHLDDDAKKLYRYVLEKDPENEAALKGLKEYAFQDLSEAELAFRKKDYDSVIYMVGKISTDYGKLTAVLTRAYELKERAENEIRREKKEKTARALSLSRRGDEYYAQADFHISALKSTERRSEIRVVSDKEEAKKFLRRAISTWEAALEIDPSLARVDKEDLNTKIKDAEAKLYKLTRVVPIPDTYSSYRQSLKQGEKD